MIYRPRFMIIDPPMKSNGASIDFICGLISAVLTILEKDILCR